MEIKKLPLTLVSPSPMNPRKTFDERELQELADNIEKQGLLQPITVRPIEDIEGFAAKVGFTGIQQPHYEIVCGERRYRAFCAVNDRRDDLGFSLIPAIIREMDDDEAFEAMITENLQRKDVDPIEEAYAFGQLIQKGKTAEEVADRFGKSIRFVQDRVKLNSLIPELMLAVREDTMPISAAMVIAKLNEDDQRKFLSQYRNNYRGYSKESAVNFTNELFMRLSRSLWSGYGDSDYDGGCGRRCSDCEFNTLNHGCLFWEMKGEDGKCTDRARYNGKTMAYMVDRVKAEDERLVKRGKPLEFGKTVVGISSSNLVDDSSKVFFSQLKERLNAIGYEVVDPGVAFRSKCFYPAEDERREEFLKNGECYRVLMLNNYRTPVLSEEAWYVKREDTGTNVGGDGTPYRVRELLGKEKAIRDGLQNVLIVEGAKVLARCTPVTDKLLDDEETLLTAFLLARNPELQKMLCLSDSNSEKALEWVNRNPDKKEMVKRAWVYYMMDASNSCLNAGKSALDDFGRLNCEEKYNKTLDKCRKKQETELRRIAKELRELGYDSEGNPLEKEQEYTPAPDRETALKQFKEMKAKHPDAVILFRVGDFCECYHEDARKVADTLELTVTSSEGFELTAFPNEALGTYLPRLVKAGVRVALAEKHPFNK